MKKLIYSLLVALLFFGGMTSCEDVLDVENESSLDESVIFSNPSLAEGAIAGIIHSFGETNSYRGRFLVYYGLNTDCEVTNSIKSYTDDKARLSNYNTNVNNGQMNTENNAWAKFYEGIERANIAIRGLRTYGDVENRPVMAQLLGEVLTLRAVVYSDLLKAWGDVPARFEPVNAETVYIPRADRDVIYKQLLADLEEAAELVPWPNESAITQSTERVNKAFVKGLRARLALTAGGYGQRLHEGGNGVIRKSTDPELTSELMYKIVKKECLDIYNSGKALLEPTFEGVFKALHEEKYVAGREILWEIPFAEGRGRVIFDLGVKHTNVDQYTAQAKGGTNGPNPIMFYEYEKDDSRRDVTCVPYEWTDGIQVPTNLNKFYFGKYRYEWLNRRVTAPNDDGLNWLYMRYSDVLLMLAEAVNELDGPAAAAPYFKEVRSRAYPDSPGAVDAYMASITASKEAFFNAIVDERALEFTGEMLRKNDLIRWNLLDSKLAEARTKLEALEKREGKYADLPAKIYFDTDDDGETVKIYGLNYGDTDVQGEALGYPENKTWKMSSDDEQISYWEALYQGDPNKQQYWPIWQVFIDTSNGMLNNKGLESK
ncbi:MAG TPA: RagB/SusD family nutrient uptake outer membrane protein [Marinilabiliaceae bacterium]|nr:RagB/SusD family nutrient uptake outer membrane protein [Marinilabiliaceae bacterium]